VRFLLSPGGATTDTYAYDAYGCLLAATGTTTNNYRYCGEQYDPDLGTYYLRAPRYLDANMARFQTMDSVGGRQEETSSLHKYLYSEDDPVDKTDPSGQDTLDSEESPVDSSVFKHNLDVAERTGVPANAVTYHVLVVVPNNGRVYEPQTTVKTQNQALETGLHVGDPMKIAVPPLLNPQKMVDDWASAPRAASFAGTWLAFQDYWSRPEHDFKSESKIFDAFGNFEFGATGAAAGFSLGTLQKVGDLLHPPGFTNVRINTIDIASGYAAISNGGRLLSIADSLTPAPIPSPPSR